MGRNNHDYKIKDKNLTKNKKNGKLNKSIAFTLAGMAAIGAGAMAGGQAQEAQAMMGRVPSAVNKVTSTFKPGVLPSSRTPGMSTPKVGPLSKSLGTTGRVLGGAPSAINSGRFGSDGTAFKGIGKNNHNNGINIVKNQNNSYTKFAQSQGGTGNISSAVQKQGLTGKTNPGAISQQVQAQGISGKGSSTTGTGTTGTPGTQTSSLGGLTLKSPSSTTTGQKQPLSTQAGSKGSQSLTSTGNTSQTQNSGSGKFQPGDKAQQMYSQKNNTGGKVHTTEGFYNYRLK